jgi:hypothetical protein
MPLEECFAFIFVFTVLAFQSQKQQLAFQSQKAALAL